MHVFDGKKTEFPFFEFPIFRNRIFFGGKTLLVSGKKLLMLRQAQLPELRCNN